MSGGEKIMIWVVVLELLNLIKILVFNFVCEKGLMRPTALHRKANTSAARFPLYTQRQRHIQGRVVTGPP